MLDKKIKGNLAFGTMRLPMNKEEVDIPQTCEMVDEFMKEGFNYFDTAHGYINGKSEPAVREALVKRYPREDYFLVTKLSGWFFEKEDELEGLFQESLDWLGVDYLDCYLMHAQNFKSYAHFKECHAYEFALNKLKEGKIKHFGISFHDTPELLEQILTEYPQIEVVQIQFNYLDYNDSAVQSKNLYDVCKKFNKPVLVMEPVKGGQLAGLLPESAKKLIKENYDLSPASLAIRFVASHKQVLMTLSGMSNIEQMKDNLSYMKNFKPLEKKDYELIDKIVAIYHDLKLVPCTGCSYCKDVCPQGIMIPNIFAVYNDAEIANENDETPFYYKVYMAKGTSAKNCIKCGSCEAVCPQHIKIREHLVEIAKKYEN